jgi:primosomal protein N' (replication factor Y)
VLVVRVLADVSALDKEFDYLVPEAMAAQVHLGSLVRIQLQGRRVGGWVTAVGVEPPPGVVLKPLAKVSGLGPSEDLIELAAWAAWRWAGRRDRFLRTASPPTAVRALPPPSVADVPVPEAADVVAAEAARGAFDHPGGLAVIRWPPGDDVGPLVLEAVRRGHALVLCPSVDQAASVAARLRRARLPVALHPRDWARGRAGCTVVGTRAAAWAPVGGLSAVLVLDEHDEGMQEERAPTWHARDVVVERARRAGVPCVLASPSPSLDALSLVAEPLAPARNRERAGWPIVDVVDRRDEDPGRSGLFSERLVHWLRTDRTVVCVLNRTGRARLLACTACGVVAGCERCAAAVVQTPEGHLRCLSCGLERPVICSVCGSTRLKNLRMGVTRAREELEALAGEPVVEVTATSEPGDQARVYVGTEAVLHRVPQAGVVAFLDFDQELLAPRFRAAEQAMALLARSAGLLGGRAAGGRLLLQTRLPDHEVVQAALHADPARLAAAEAEKRTLLELPPSTALALVTGAGAAELTAAIPAGAPVEVLEEADYRFLVRAADHQVLCDTLAATPRPKTRVRVEVDPLRA